MSPVFPVLTGRFFTTSSPGKSLPRTLLIPTLEDLDDEIWKVLADEF